MGPTNGVELKLSSDSFVDGGILPAWMGFGDHDPVGNLTFAGNKTPHLAWSDLPEGTASLALVMVDPDVPSRFDDANQPGRKIPADLPRVDLYHWSLIDIDPALGSIMAGAFSDGVTVGGKSGPQAPFGTRQALNCFTSHLAENPDMAGSYYGYDGPCPPGNDEINHRYIFTLYALDVVRLGVEGDFEAEDVMAAIEGHVLDSATIGGQYVITAQS